MGQVSMYHKVCWGRQFRNQTGVTVFGLSPESWSSRPPHPLGM